MAFSNIITIPNLDENKVKEIILLLAVIKTKMTAFTRFLGSEDGKAPGLLLDKLELWIGSTPEYPIISKTNEMALKELTGQIIAEAVKTYAGPFLTTLEKFFLSQCLKTMNRLS